MCQLQCKPLGIQMCMGINSVSLKRQLTLIVVSLMLEATQGTIGAHGRHTVPSQHLEEMNSM